MKKGLLILACLLVIASFSACSGIEKPLSSASSVSSAPSQPVLDTTTPTGTVTLLMESVKTLDMENIDKYVTSKTTGNKIFGSGSSFSNFSADEKLGLEIAKKFTKNIRYKILGESIDEANAKVEIELGVPDIAKAITSAMSDLAKKAAIAAITGQTIDMEALVFEYIRDKIDFSKVASSTATAKVNLIKQADGTWLVDNDAEVNMEFIDALTGNIINKLGEYADLFGF